MSRVWALTGQVSRACQSTANRSAQMLLSSTQPPVVGPGLARRTVSVPCVQVLPGAGPRPRPGQVGVELGELRGAQTLARIGAEPRQRCVAHGPRVQAGRGRLQHGPAGQARRRHARAARATCPGSTGSRGTRRRWRPDPESACAALLGQRDVVAGQRRPAVAGQALVRVGAHRAVGAEQHQPEGRPLRQVRRTRLRWCAAASTRASTASGYADRGIGRQRARPDRALVGLRAHQHRRRRCGSAARLVDRRRGRRPVTESRQVTAGRLRASGSRATTLPSSPEASDASRGDGHRPAPRPARAHPRAPRQRAAYGRVGSSRPATDGSCGGSPASAARSPSSSRPSRSPTVAEGVQAVAARPRPRRRRARRRPGPSESRRRSTARGPPARAGRARPAPPARSARRRAGRTGGQRSRALVVRPRRGGAAGRSSRATRRSSAS